MKRAIWTLDQDNRTGIRGQKETLVKEIRSLPYTHPFSTRNTYDATPMRGRNPSKMKLYRHRHKLDCFGRDLSKNPPLSFPPFLRAP